MTIGILANQVPVINADEALKGAQFIRMCNQQYVQMPGFSLSIPNVYTEQKNTAGIHP